MEATSSSAHSARGAGRIVALLGLALGLIGGVLLVVAEFSTIVSIDVASGTCAEQAGADLSDGCETTGLEQHGGALIVLGVAAVVLAWPPRAGANRPAALALIAVGVLAVGLALVRDVDEPRDGRGRPALREARDRHRPRPLPGDRRRRPVRPGGRVDVPRGA